MANIVEIIMNAQDNVSPKLAAAVQQIQKMFNTLKQEVAISQQVASGVIAANDGITRSIGRKKTAYHDVNEAAKNHQQTLKEMAAGYKIGGDTSGFSRENQRFAAEDSRITKQRLDDAMRLINRDKEQRASAIAAHRERLRLNRELQDAGRIDAARRRELDADSSKQARRDFGPNLARQSLINDLAAHRARETEERRHAAAMNEIRGGTLRNAAGTTFVPHPSARPGDQTMLVDAAKLERAWRASQGYIAAGGEGVAGRRAGVERFLDTGQAVQASRVVFGPHGVPDFDDGRHRFRVQRDRGAAAVAVTVPAEDAAQMRARFGVSYVGGAANPEHARQEAFAVDQRRQTDDFKKGLQTRRELAKLSLRQELAELKALRDRGQLTPDEVGRGAAQSLQRYRDDSGLTERRNKDLAEKNRLNREGAALTERNRTAQERHNAVRERATQLLEAGKITQKDFEREVAASNKTLAAQPSLLSDITSRVMSAAAAYLSFQGVLRLAGAELQNVHERQRKAQSAAMTFAEARNEAIQNLDESMRQPEFDTFIEEQSRRHGVSQTFLMKGASGALGAKGPTTTSRQALEAMLTALPLNRFKPEDLNAVTSAILLGQTAEPGKSVKEIWGQQIQAKLTSPVQNPAEFATNIVPIVAASSAFGDTQKEGYGLAAYLGGRMGDKVGRKTGTTLSDWQRDLDQLDKGLKSEQAGREFGANTRERLEAIAFNPKFKSMRDTLLGKTKSALATELGMSGGRMTSEAKGYGAIMQLYQGDPEAWKNLRAAMGRQIDAGPQAAKLVEQQQTELEASPAHRTAIQEKETEAGVENLHLDNTLGARIKQNRQKLDETLEASGASIVDRTIRAKRFDFQVWSGGEAPEAVANRELKNRSLFLRTLGSSMFGGPSDQDRHQATLIDEQVTRNADALQREILAEQKETNRLLREAAGKTPVVIAPPVAPVNRGKAAGPASGAVGRGAPAAPGGSRP